MRSTPFLGVAIASSGRFTGFQIILPTPLPNYSVAPVWFVPGYSGGTAQASNLIPFIPYGTESFNFLESRLLYTTHFYFPSGNGFFVTFFPIKGTFVS